MTPNPAELDYRPRQLVLVDDDLVFRAGLRLWLNQFRDLEVVDEAERGEQALRSLEQRLAPLPDALPPEAVDLVIVSLDLGRNDPGQMPSLELCQQIRSRYPRLPVLLLGETMEPILVEAMRQAGATGYGLKTADQQSLIGLIRQVIAGQPTFPALRPNASRDASVVSPTAITPDRAFQITPFRLFRRNLRRSSVRQINAALEDCLAQLQDPSLSILDRAFLAGRVRELYAARWLVQRLLATPQLPDATLTEANQAALSDRPTAPVSPSSAEPSPTAAALVVQSPQGIYNPAPALRSLLVDQLLDKIQTGTANLTGKVLETDILRSDRKRELFCLVLRQFEELLEELRFSQVQPAQIEEKRSQLLLDLWQAVTIEFFGKYATVSMQGYEVEVVSSLLQEARTVQESILGKIPGVAELLNHLLFQTPLLVNGTPVAAGTPEAIHQAESLLGNLVIQTANAVMQPLLNRFADVEAIKQKFYDYRLLSSREIARFRNNLSWRYRVDQYFEEPKAIFESQYRLLVFHAKGIKMTSIYAPRREELERLSGVQYAVTLALETRDAIAPRLRSAVSIVGSGIIYVLTEVIGRGIGLVGRGILKGIGNTWQDVRSPRNGGDRSRKN